MGILIIDPKNINLDNTNCDEYDSETIIHVRLLAWGIKFKNAKHLKKS